MSIKIAVKDDVQKDVVLAAWQLTVGKLYRALQHDGTPYEPLTTLYTGTVSGTIVWFESNRCGTYETEGNERKFILAPAGSEVSIQNRPR